MAYQQLSSSTMISISASWLERERLIWERDANLKLLLPRLEEAHQALLDNQRTPNARLKWLIQEAREVDHRHNQRARALHILLKGGLNMVQREEERLKIDEALQFLFPYGLSIVKKSYRDKAGAAYQLKDQINDEIRSTLREIKVFGRDLTGVLDEWIEAGIQLGKLQDERETEEVVPSTESATSADIHKARVTWNRIVDVMERLLMMSSEIEEEDKKTLLAPLRAAEEAARRKRRPKTDAHREERHH